MKRVSTVAVFALALMLLISSGCASWFANGDGGGGGNTPAEANNPPVISSLTATPSNVAPGADTTLAIAATDADGDTLTYAWTGGGVFAAAGAATTLWHHATAGAYSLTCKVTDGNGGQTAGVVTILVSEAGGGNLPPVITNISAAPPAVPQDGDTTLAVVASDPEGGALTYAWAGSGTFTNAAAATTTWHFGTVGLYSLSCTVSDADGGQTVGTVVVSVSVPEPANQEPVVDTALAGDVAAPVVGQKMILSAVASDPDGDSLTVLWDDGSGSGNFSDPSLDDATGEAKATWTAPSAGAFTITASFDDGKVASFRNVSAITNATLDVTVADYPATFDFVGVTTCLGCHAAFGDQAAGTGWYSTNHHDAIERNLSDPANTHAYRNPSCYGCHALGWAPTVDGQGFIDMDLTPEMANIQCESCHGGGNPQGMGAGHKPRPWDPGLGYQHDADGYYVLDAVTGAPVPDDTYDGSNGYGCGQCHEGSRHGSFEEWAKSGHANQPNAPLKEDDGAGGFVIGPAGEASCVKCHNGQFFVDITIKGNAPPAADMDPADTVPYAMGINCSTCHDPHNKANDLQLRIGPGDSRTLPFDDIVVEGGAGNICIECHNGRRTRANYDTYITNPGSRFGVHGNPQAPFLFGVEGADFDGTPVAYDNEHPHNTWNPNSCTTCHMFRHDYVDAGNPADWGHDFEPAFEGCITCHTTWTIDQEADFWTWVEEFQADEYQARMDAFVAAWPAAWKDVSDPASPVLRFKETNPGDGDGPVVGDAAVDPAAQKGNWYREALWNYKYALMDVSKGVHNPTFMEDMLSKATARVEELNAMP